MGFWKAEKRTGGGGLEKALDVWVTQAQAGSKVEHFLCNLLLFENTDAQSSIRATRRSEGSDMDQEYTQVRRLVVVIREEASIDIKLGLIEELEQVPIHRIHFYDRWVQIHTTTFPFACWEGDGYFPERSTLPRDVQLLMGSMYGKSDIENGGFHQFFTNSTGRLAPEMVEWCERARLHDAANCIKEAMSYFGSTYPRSDEDRHVRLDWNPLDGNEDINECTDRSELDPFCQLDDRFNEEIFPHKDDTFDLAADHWLKVTCGINRLSTPPV